MTADVVDAPRRRVTLEELRAPRDGIAEIGRRYGVSNIHVFGASSTNLGVKNLSLALYNKNLKGAPFVRTKVSPIM
jgi:hypothetical protein